MALVQGLGRHFIESTKIELVASPCKHAIQSLIQNVSTELHIVSPFVTDAGISVVIGGLDTSTGRLPIAVQLLTDLNPLSVCQGSCDPQAILHLVRLFPCTEVVHLPRVHAKILVADRRVAMIGSANLTEGGMQDNYEYCVKISSRKMATKIVRDVEGYSSLGAPITVDLLESYVQAATSLSEIFRRKEHAVSLSLKREFDAHVRSASDLLLQARVRAKEGVTGIFSRTILFLLRMGPMRTVDIHPKIQRIHPDLCDDSVDRVIDGERFGKKWKHLVRTAQQILKRNGLIEFDGRSWRRSKSRSA